MPANVSIEFAKAKEKYEEAGTLMEKLIAMQEMKRTAPKHKGAEKLRAEISGRIAKLKNELEKQKLQEKKRGAATGLSVRKEGCGQVAIVGLPNSGKSTLLRALSGVDVEIAPYPFTTKKPAVGMMNYKNAMVQLVEIPALVEGSSEGRAQGSQLLSIVRNADAIIMAVRSGEEEKTLLNELRKARIMVNQQRPQVKVKRSDFKGIAISGEKYLKVGKDELIDFLKSLGIYNASVVLREPAGLEKVAEALENKNVYRRAITVNALEEKNIEPLREKVFRLLDKILIFTKKPGEDADRKEPMVVNKGATVGDVAAILHKDFAEKLSYARVWGSSKFPGQRVAKDYRLEDNDLIEIYC